MEFFDHQFERLRRAANKVAARDKWSVLFFSPQPHLLDADEFVGYESDKIENIRFVSDEAELAQLEQRFDIAVIHVCGDFLANLVIRRKNLCDFVFVWSWDNHHSEGLVLKAKCLADVAVPAHGFCSSFMKSPGSIVGKHVPLATYQWSRRKAKGLYNAYLLEPRDDNLHGGFQRYGRHGEDREGLVTALQESLPTHALRLIDPADHNAYFNLSPAEKWRDWASHKVGLILPYHFDLPIRFFDSLMTGQVPIVPRWCRDFDAVISPEIQATLPVIRLDEPSVENVIAAWREALLRFDADGMEGARRRHLFAVDNHHLINRIEAICRQVIPVAAGSSLRLDADADSVGFVLTE